MFSKLVRRTHMYLALFLAPWMLMYAASTVVMNHRAYFGQQSGGESAPYAVERQLVSADVFPEDSEPSEISRQILQSLNLDGAHVANRRRDGAIVIERNDLISPRRITYTPATQEIVIEKQEARPPAFLERFHRRRGYTTGYGLDTAWAVSIEVVIVAMVFWSLSGLWMWWELKGLRMWGAAAMFSGLGLFVLFLFTI